MTSYETTSTTRLSLPELGACALVQDLLPLYLEGEVSPGSRDLIVEHLARCEKCAGFLAGAQSVRAQVRRDTAQRANVTAREQPALQAVARGTWLATAIAVLTSSVFGAGGSFLLLSGLADHRPFWLLAGGLIVVVSFVFLAVMAGSRGPLSWQRMLALLASCGLGAASAIPLYLGGGAASVGLSLLIGLLGLAGVWASVAAELGALPPVGSPPVQLDSRAVLTTGLLLGGGLLLLVPLLLSQAFSAPVMVCIVVVLALVVGLGRG